jgi:uncharacterized RDD family membrane protein YckC
VAQRIGAALLDVLVVSPVSGFFAWRAWNTGDAAWGWLGVVVVAAYHIALTAMWGQTIGKRVARCKVVMDLEPAVDCTWSGATIRYAVLVGPGLVPRVGAILGFGVLVWALFGMAPDELGRGIQDQAAGTRVVDLRSRGSLTDRVRAAQPRPEPRPRRKHRRATWQP